MNDQVMANTIYDTYETVIGLEVHVQLATQSKAFCADDASYGGAPNTHVSAISLGHPGTLPRLNKKQIEYAVRLGLALGSTISRRSTFDRKNYFYADLPKGYQITQDQQPICIGGTIDIEVEDVKRRIRIHHCHAEEDAGKSSHEGSSPYSFIDLNRAGVPLLEIVTEPDLRSAEEVDALMTAMRQLVQYLGISDGNMQEGSMRCDCNISVRKKGDPQLGERCEVKNLNSMRYARRAIKFEVKRQIDLLESGGKVRQQTLNFDPATGETSPLRDKEDAHDYRYFPEPDLPPVVLSESQLQSIADQMPMLPWEMHCLLKKQYQLSDYDLRILTLDLATAQYYQQLAQLTDAHKPLANLFINKLIPFCNEKAIRVSKFPVPPEALISLLQLIESGKISHSAAYQQLLPFLIEHPQSEPEAAATQLNILQNDDADALEGIISEVLEAFPDKVAAYRKGKKGLIGFFMGEVMKKSKGQADPRKTKELLNKALA